MLIFDDSKGASDGKERGQLQAMVAVGSEFITYRDDESTVQKSGQFVRIEKESSDAQPRFVLLHETTQTYTNTGEDLTGNELLGLAPNVKLRKRSRLYMSETDPTNGDLPFREIGGFKAQTRISRHHGPAGEDRPRGLEAMCEANYTAQAGKRRLFARGDGTALLVREVAVPGDARYFNDSLRELVPTPQPHTKERGLRAARVEVVSLNVGTGGTGKPLLSFDIHSGLGFNPAPRFFSNNIRVSSADMYDANNVYAAFAGALFGSSLNLPGVNNVPLGGDASDTYAVCEPALAKASDGREYLSLVAVFPAPDDVYDDRSAGPYRLTCKRTTPGGDAATTKINFPGLPHLPAHYLAARGMSLHRMGVDTVVLRVNVHAMQFGAGGSIQPVNSDAFFMWSLDNGETWAYVAPAVGFPGVFPYGGMLVKDEDTLLAFGWPQGAVMSSIQVHQVTAGGTALLSTIAAATLCAGLVAPLGGGASYPTPYVPFGFGGAIYKQGADGKKKRRLWMQFDPYWNYEQGESFVIEYPGSRPMLLVSDDEGMTWARRLLPVPWSFRVGFVVAIGGTALAVPVYAPRANKGAPLRATIYLSRDGGDSWKATSHKVTLPGETWVDGGIVLGAQYLDGHGDHAAEQDFGDSATEYNRGELLPMLALRDSAGKVLPSNPARPWMADYRFKEPTYG